MSTLYHPSGEPFSRDETLQHWEDVGASWLACYLDDDRPSVPSLDEVVGAYAGHCDSVGEINDPEMRAAFLGGALGEALVHLRGGAK